MKDVKKILIINGSYREDGITDRAAQALTNALGDQGIDTEIILLRDQEIHFCLNCRECMQKPGPDPEPCVQHDAMDSIVAKIEAADGYILAAPTNLGSATALFKRFMERLAVYAYWPWGGPAPKYRKDNAPRKKAVIITSSSAPGFLGRWLFGTSRQLKYTARIMGADHVGTLYSGLIANEAHAELPNSTNKKVISLVKKLQ